MLLNTINNKLSGRGDTYVRRLSKLIASGNIKTAIRAAGKMDTMRRDDVIRAFADYGYKAIAFAILTK